MNVFEACARLDEDSQSADWEGVIDGSVEILWNEVFFSHRYRL